MVPDIQLRLGSQRLILLTARRVPDIMFFLSYTSGSRRLMLLIARRVRDVETQPFKYIMYRPT